MLPQRGARATSAFTSRLTLDIRRLLAAFRIAISFSDIRLAHGRSPVKASMIFTPEAASHFAPIALHRLDAQIYHSPYATH